MLNSPAKPLEGPARIALANLPTPLQYLPASSSQLGVELWMKRDDLTGAELSGNKVRKLEFLLAEARDQGADTVITCGGTQSNHCRATALAARRLGLDSVLLLRTADPKNPPATRGNILLDRLAGADLRWITPQQYRERQVHMGAVAEELAARGRRAYVIPEGGSSATGCWGYVRAAAELASDLAALPPKPTTVIYACGSGGTGAGLVLGLQLTGLGHLARRVAGVNVCDDRDYFVSTISRLCREFDQKFATRAAVQEADIDIIDGYVGRGYALSRPEELDTLIQLARADGVILDPVYTGKAFYGLTRELAAGRDLGSRVVFLHTGGIFGLLAEADTVAERLP